jgi:hypothetical protein
MSDDKQNNVNDDDKVIEEDTQNQDDDLDDNQQKPDDSKPDDNSLEDELEKKVQERLAKMKDNMDRMAKARDEALKKAAELEEQQKKAKMEQLEKEGKLQELAEMKAAELEAKLKVIEEENVKLKRDQVLHSKLATLEFRNERSKDMAYRDIVDQLTQDDNGNWVHSSGKSISDFVESYSKEEDNSFLFKTKSNSGAGKSGAFKNSDTTQTKKITEMSTQEILKAAREGKLGNFKY